MRPISRTQFFGKGLSANSKVRIRIYTVISNPNNKNANRYANDILIPTPSHATLGIVFQIVSLICGPTTCVNSLNGGKSLSLLNFTEYDQHNGICR